MARKSGSKSEITGPRVREVAQSLFATRGYAAVSMRDIASGVGVQAGALYNYTPDKQTLLFRLMYGHMEDLLLAWANEVKPDEPLSRLEHFTRFHIRYHIDRPDEVFIAYMELRNLTDENFKKVENLRKTYETELTGILQAGQKTGDFVIPDVKLTTMALIAMLTGVNTWYREGGRLDQNAIEQAYWDMVRSIAMA